MPVLAVTALAPPEAHPQQGGEPLLWLRAARLALLPAQELEKGLLRHRQAEERQAMALVLQRGRVAPTLEKSARCANACT